MKVSLWSKFHNRKSIFKINPPKKQFKISIIALSFIILLTFIITYDPIKTIFSLKKVDSKLYLMEYYGDYDTILKRVDKNFMKNLPDTNAESCSLFTTFGDHSIYGRNLDVNSAVPLVLISHPYNGYASISMSNIEALGFTNATDILSLPFKDKLRLLSAPYYAWDGMNEWGLTVAAANVPKQNKYPSAPEKKTINALYLRRLLLDHAKNTNEAIALLKEYNIVNAGSMPAHFLISDPSGHSVVIEIVEGDLNIIPSTEPWQVLTNFYISYSSKEPIRPGYDRYITLYKGLQESDGKISPISAMSLLKDVSKENTMWSLIYDMSTGDVYVSLLRNYEKINQFKISLKK